MKAARVWNTNPLPCCIDFNLVLPADYLQSTSVSSSDTHQYLRAKCSGECGRGHGWAVCGNEMKAVTQCSMREGLHVQETSRDRNSLWAQKKYMRNKSTTAVPTLAAVNTNKGLQS